MKSISRKNTIYLFSANRKFTLVKEEWDTVALERLELAIDPAKSADVAAVVMQEGLANLMLISGSLTLSRAKIDISVPRKRHGAAAQQHEKALARFFEAIVQAILRHVNFEIVKCVLIASPGFTKDQFYEHMMTFANKLGDGKILLVRKNFFFPLFFLKILKMLGRFIQFAFSRKKNSNKLNRFSMVVFLYYNVNTKQFRVE